MYDIIISLILSFPSWIISIAVIVLSVPGESVRQFLLTAYDLGYPQSGEYVFLDVELFRFRGEYWGDHSWRRGDERDAQAREAYQALLRVALHMPHGQAYQRFAEDVKRLAYDTYGFDYDALNESVSEVRNTSV